MLDCTQLFLYCTCLYSVSFSKLLFSTMVPLFFLETAFLLSDAHVTAMFQCLEAVEQNNPRLLAQIDASMVTGEESPMSVPGLSISP